MTSVDAFEAKTHLAALLKRVATGETIEITRRGVPVARLVPALSSEMCDRKKLAAEIRQLRQDKLLRGLSIRRLINDGRRF